MGGRGGGGGRGGAGEEEDNKRTLAMALRKCSSKGHVLDVHLLGEGNMTPSPPNVMPMVKKSYLMMSSHNVHEVMCVEHLLRDVAILIQFWQSST